MRNVLSTTLVACLVGALAGVTANAVAQSPARPPMDTTALNADTVDGKSAVSATSKKRRRANKLVATDSKGFLPSNIVKARWGLITDKPGFLADGQVGWNEVAGIPGSLADGQVGWNEVAGIPAGFADLVDNEGVTGVKLSIKVGSSVPLAAAPPGVPQEAFADASCPAGSIVAGGGFSTDSKYQYLTASYPAPGNIWRVWVANTDPAAGHAFNAYAMCLSVDPAGALTIARKGLAPATLKKATKKRRR